MQQVTPQDTQDTIRNLGDKFRYFHLSVCVCGAPGWQQPCPVCSYYPRGDGLRSCRRSVTNPSDTRIIASVAVPSNGAVWTSRTR